MYSYAATRSMVEIVFNSGFLQVPVQLGLCLGHSLKELLNDLLVVLRESLVDFLELCLGVLVYGCLRVGLRALILEDRREGLQSLPLSSTHLPALTSFWNAWNSFSLLTLISSISLAASERASLSFCVRSVKQAWSQQPCARTHTPTLGDSLPLQRTGAGLLHNLGRLLFCLEQRLDSLRLLSGLPVVLRQ